MEKNSNGMKKNTKVKVFDFGKVDSLFDLLKVLGKIAEIEMKEGEKEKQEEESDAVEDAIKRIANKMDVDYSDANKFLAKLSKINPAAAFSVVSKEIAIKLDEKYEGNIKDSDKIFIISMLDGKIHEVHKNSIKNYRNFAAFRTLDDAKSVCILLKDKLRAMFKEPCKCNKTTEK